ncbi:4-(cytidine 5'-diphospho)-2-C-methyl-D-erythritol kinase [Salinarimonas soli]|uniref:4-diphosphocytidyl-2-C-methyl-D-erythritol kinase n=1 Tax=Salinarimonas soli TaxID=1638099 RepID=A0A5B2VQY0_9HYPH|nr:4-(cytidine 5'-diphospho)-2-C-methyl-D-erythritol kinase [Salinarimonas soli]KAA2242173.1 4-(cytidine 5'-diphospho)-2-C-methyl-D-erythritol kinase [Salinarimonas soli]
MSPAGPGAAEAPAKVNLYLKVVGRRPDGYHLLDSLAVFADPADRLAAEPADDLSLVVDGPFAGRAGPVESNLVLKAARLLREHARSGMGARLRLTKLIPVEAGLGGGSSDAAAALRLLDALWETGFDEARLREMGARLGADVPVCVAGRPTLMAGIGEALTPAPALPPLAILLVNPGVATATPAVFRAYAALERGPAPPPLAGPIRDVEHLAEELRLRGNDLLPAACTVAPVVGEVVAELERLPGAVHASMSGSGATGFALFRDTAAARTAAETLAERRPGWWSHAGAVRA